MTADADDKTKAYTCERCGAESPAFLIADDKNDIVGCCECPDVHDFDGGRCTACDRYSFDKDLPAFCVMKQH